MCIYKNYDSNDSNDRVALASFWTDSKRLWNFYTFLTPRISFSVAARFFIVRAYTLVQYSTGPRFVVVAWGWGVIVGGLGGST